jgi:hypothetical protein
MNLDSMHPVVCYTNGIGCSLCRLIRHPEHLSGRHWNLLKNWRSCFRWSPDQWVSQCYTIECHRSFCCAPFSLFMTCVSQCPIGQRSEHPVYIHVYKEQSTQQFAKNKMDTNPLTFALILLLTLHVSTLISGHHQAYSDTSLSSWITSNSNMDLYCILNTFKSFKMHKSNF